MKIMPMDAVLAKLGIAQLQLYVAQLRDFVGVFVVFIVWVFIGPR
jgi:hypothetical protein